MDIPAKLDNQILDLIASGVSGKFKRVVITRDTMLQKELGLDSIGMLSLVFRFEELFGIDIAQLGIEINISKLKTVDDLVTAARDILSKVESVNAG